jgi:hypothetical protein
MHAINVSYKSLSVAKGTTIEGTRRTMHPSSFRLPTTHGLRALGAAILWGLIEVLALARSRRSRHDAL